MLVAVSLFNHYKIHSCFQQMGLVLWKGKSCTCTLLLQQVHVELCMCNNYTHCMVPYEYKYPHELKYLPLMTKFNRGTSTYAPEFTVWPSNYGIAGIFCRWKLLRISRFQGKSREFYPRNFSLSMAASLLMGVSLLFPTLRKSFESQNLTFSNLHRFLPVKDSRYTVSKSADYSFFLLFMDTC